MSGGIEIIRGLLIYGICLPLAIFIGYLLASPLDTTTFALVLIVVMTLLMPILLRWHHPLLILAWNTSNSILVLGGPTLGTTLAMASLGIAISQRAMSRERRFLSAPSTTWPIIFVTVVVIITAELTGGFGFRIFGSGTVGAKRYLALFAAFAGYFALISQRIPVERARRYVGMYILGATATIIGPTIFAFAPGVYFIYLFFPIDLPYGFGIVPDQPFTRIVVLGSAGGALVCFMMARYGIAGIFSSGKPWRLLLLIAFLGMALLSGFRSLALVLLITFAFQFWLEGLFRSRLLPLFALFGVLTAALVIPLATRLPYAIQRAIAFLPIQVDPMVRLDAEGSNNWRLRMWETLWPEIPQYLLLGRGLGIRATDLAMSAIDMKVGYEENYYASMLAGDYHSGPLSVVMSFGIWGVIGFLWFIAAAMRLLHRNHRYGDVRLRTQNAYLFASFIAQLIIFLFVAGGFYSQFMSFTGIAGLSIALNGGICKPAPAPAPAAKEQPELANLLPQPVASP